MLPRVTAAALLALVACTRTAAISRYQLPSYEARIVDGDAEAIVVEDEQGGRHRVPRREIVEIDHPGNGAFFAGLGLLAVGGMGLSVETDKDATDKDDGGDGLVFASVLAGSGALLTLLGGYNWMSSRDAAGGMDPPPIDPRPGVQPPTVPLVPVDPYAPR